MRAAFSHTHNSRGAVLDCVRTFTTKTTVRTFTTTTQHHLHAASQVQFSQVPNRAIKVIQVIRVTRMIRVNRAIRVFRVIRVSFTQPVKFSVRSGTRVGQ